MLFTMLEVCFWLFFLRFEQPKIQTPQAEFKRSLKDLQSIFSDVKGKFNVPFIFNKQRTGTTNYLVYIFFGGLGKSTPAHSPPPP